jgi:hypothetical protein
MSANTHRHDIPTHLEDGFGWRDGQDLIIKNLALDASRLRRDGIETNAANIELLQSAMSDIAAILEGTKQ